MRGFLFLVLIIVLITLSSSLLLPNIPKTSKDFISSNVISSSSSIAILSSLLLPNVVKAEGKLEYQPALQVLLPSLLFLLLLSLSSSSL